MQYFRAFERDCRGNIALKFAFIFPAVVLLGAGAIDLNAVRATQARLQSIADAAALAGGAELGMAADHAGPVARSRSFIAASMSEWPDAPGITEKIEVIGPAPGSLRVNLASRRPSFFGDLLPPGGWRIGVEAIASPAQIVPLCVLSHGTGEVLLLEDSAQVRAGTCRIHSNDRITAAGSTSILAAMTQSVGAARGNIRESPQVGAPAIPDPYAGRPVSLPGSCSAHSIVEVTTSRSLAPGLHCDDYVVAGSAELFLLPGDHYFSGNRLELRERARLRGANVALVFDHAAFDFLGSSRVTLGGRTDGPLAGFVIVGLRPPEGWCPRGRPPEGGDDDDDDDDEGGAGSAPSRPADCRLGSEFLMASDNVDSLDGVIYTPASKLIVEGTREIAEGSDWTVMVVERLVIRGRPILVVKSDYAASDVPVPPKVGPRAGGVALVR